MNDRSKKYELIDVGDKYNGNTKVYRVKALRDFGFVKKGEVGGFIENEDNLSHKGNCWVYDDAYVIDKAKVYEDAIVATNAWVFDNAEVYGNAKVSGDAFIYHHAKVFGDAKVYDYGRVYNSAQVFGNAIVHGNARVKGTMKASQPVTMIDNSEVIITVTDNQVHVYQSKVYEKEDLPEKLKLLIDFSKK
ncbi:MAG: hypothetical protein RBT45_08550 [Acholeplasmataceae bacterium]|jgi:carbonic anhydrase/acetyltransferase-like protein (isoleucine patch superfamily)|nr:hypothetical protein [Acholeplasmataceae bacterium]